MAAKGTALSGFFWSFLDNSITQGFNFIVGIVLARILSPDEFGIMGILIVFITVFETILDSGFSQALIQKKNVTDNDFSTVFYFNLLIGVVIYCALFFSAPAFEDFLEISGFVVMLRVMSLGLVIRSTSITHSTFLITRVNFKTQALVTLVSSLSSGILAISLAYNNYGVWSLIARSLSFFTFTSIALWFLGDWKPKWVFDWVSFKSLFSFGSKLFASNLLNTAYEKLYYLLIGKFFSTSDLGFYTRADQFKDIVALNITAIVHRVTFPLMVKSPRSELKVKYKMVINSTMIIAFSLMLGLVAMSEPLIITLIGSRWLPSVFYLKLLSVIGMFYPLNALNLSILNVFGRSDLFLKIEIIKKILTIPVFFIAIWMGIEQMLYAMIVLAVISYFISFIWSGRMINYSLMEQLSEIVPILIMVSIAAFLVYYSQMLFRIENSLLQLAVQSITYLIVLVGIFELFRNGSYIFLRQLIIKKIRS